MNDPVGHEKTDVRAKPLILWGLLLVFFCVACFAIVLVMFNVLDGLWSTHGPREHRLATAQRPSGQPLIQVNEAEDLADFRARQKQITSTYGWVDRQAGVARIPVEKAKELLLGENRLETRQ
jgi:hypothetical protein